MGEQRKVFRIEEIAAGQRTARADETISAPSYAEIMQELRALRALIAPSAQPVANGSQRVAVEPLTSALALVHERPVRSGARTLRGAAAPTTRIRACRDSEVATRRGSGRRRRHRSGSRHNLAAALKDGIDRGLQDSGTASCSFKVIFQDLTSQRVTKAMTALKEMEGLASALAEIAPGGARRRYRGRAWEGGHASPIDILVDRA